MSQNGAEAASASEDRPGPPSWPVHPDVDLNADDPALVEGVRRCVATKADGERCQANPPRDSVLCNGHSRRLDPSLGAQALAKKRRDARRRAEDRVAARALGTRAAVAAKLAASTEQVEQALDHLLTAAATGDLKSAQALLPWIDQALGRPTERVEQLAPTSKQDLDKLGTKELEALVAQGRERLKLVEDKG
jgi:hypothetical protein